MAEAEGQNEAGREVEPAMVTKGLGWSGRERSLGSEETQGAAKGGGEGERGGGQKSRPTPPLGPGMREDASKRFGRGGVDERFQDLEDPLRDVPDDTEVDAEGVVREARIEELLGDLDKELVALNVVKTRIREIASLLVVDRLRRSIGLESDPPTLHMVFTGSPGTGKTTVAKKMGQILSTLGYVRKGHVVSVSRDDLVGQYVGHTAPKTREVLKRAMGGVLFIDEAYHLYRVDNERDYGQETVEILLEVMENQRNDLVVIMAGYKDRMDRFFSDVPGLSSRIAHHIDFPDYELPELVEIAQLMIAQQRYRFGDDAEAAFQDYLELRMSQPRFANGRSVRNGLDRARMRQAVRLYDAAMSGQPLTKRDLVTIEKDDVLKSRVFEGGAYADGDGAQPVRSEARGRGDEDAPPAGTDGGKARSGAAVG